MTDYYIVFYVHDDYNGDVTIYRCLKSFDSYNDASAWAYKMRRKVHDRTIEHFDPLPPGFEVEDLDSLEITIHPQEKWIEQLKKAADDIEKYTPEDNQEDDDDVQDDENPDPG